MQGVLSGLAHPVIGIDHLAFIAGMGIVLGLGLARRILAPIALVGAAGTGTLLQWAGLALPLGETIVALSLIAVAAVVVFEPQRKSLVTGAAAIAALCHGQAYGEAIIGAEPTPLGAYLIGFTLIQVTIATALYLGTRCVVSRYQAQSHVWRIGSGIALASTGAVFMGMATAL